MALSLEHFLMETLSNTIFFTTYAFSILNILLTEHQRLIILRSQKWIWILISMKKRLSESRRSINSIILYGINKLALCGDRSRCRIEMYSYRSAVKATRTQNFMKEPRFHYRSGREHEGHKEVHLPKEITRGFLCPFGSESIEWVAAEKRCIPDGMHTIKHGVETCVRFASMHPATFVSVSPSLSLACSVRSSSEKRYRNKTSTRSYISPLSQFHLVLCHSISIYFVMRLGLYVVLSRPLYRSQ